MISKNYCVLEANHLPQSAKSMQVIDLGLNGSGTISTIVHTDRIISCALVQVLTAVGEGETILTALQEAVPEDVRGNMATAVTGAVQARIPSFNLVGFGKRMPPSLLLGFIDSIKKNLQQFLIERENPSPLLHFHLWIVRLPGRTVIFTVHRRHQAKRLMVMGLQIQCNLILKPRRRIQQVKASLHSLQKPCLALPVL